MIRLSFISVLFFLSFYCFSQTDKELPLQNSIIINVGVFDKNGDSPYCITDAIESVRIDKYMNVRIISASEIVSGGADDIDVFIFPGGSGRSETLSLGELGQKRIIELVTQEGKGVLGICAGAYILTETPNYPSLALSAGEAIDIEHDHRGHGLVKFSLTEKGKEIFPELADREISFSKYYEGPVLIPAKHSKYKYQELAVMESDVHIVAGSPADMTNNRPFIIITENGKGMSASVVGHPEATAGMRWMIPRLVRIVAKRKMISYGDNVVRPEIYNKEILFTPDQQQLYLKAYDNLIGSKEEKMQAITDMVSMSAWSAKKWTPSMLRDGDFEVRLLAAKLTVDLERTDALPDLRAAVAMEENIENKKELEKQAVLLEAMIGKRD